MKQSKEQGPPVRQGVVAFVLRLGARLEQMAAERPVFLAFLVFVGATFLVIPLSLPFYLTDTVRFLENIMAEAHGTLFDLLIIGWFLLWLNKLADRRRSNNRYREEIDDYLGWKSPEATHRIAGNIRRLNRGGVVEKLRLTEAYLHGASLPGAQLKAADLWGATLDGANLREACLEEANMAGASLEGADLERASMERADLRGATLKEADLERVVLTEADLRGALLMGVDLQYAFLLGTNLERANLSGANLRGANLQEANLTGAKLAGANLRGADLHGALLRDVDLTGADLLGANLVGAVLPEGEDLLATFAKVRTLFGAKFKRAAADALQTAYPVLFQISDHQPREMAKVDGGR